MQKTPAPSRSLIIWLLGAMTALSPFSIDMYLPAFQQIALDFNTSVARVSLSLSSYFVGLACGQLFYGPLLDRFGRKQPLYVGLSIYIVASLFCLRSHSTDFLIAFRFIQAIGACSAGVASMAMVRDLFTTKESAKVFSLLILILGASPLLAPTIGGFVTTRLGWQAIFIILALMATGLVITIKIKLPETHTPDPAIILRPVPILKNYHTILRHPEFYTYALANSVAFSGLFVYLAGSPIIFMQTYKVSAQVYGWIFASVAAGLIGSSQLNVHLLKKFTNEGLLRAALMSQVAIAAVFLTGIHFEWFNLVGTVIMLFFFLGCFGICNPNAAALALSPFTKNAGSASALIGFLQMSLGALASMSIGLFNINSLFPVITILLFTSSTALIILFIGKRKIGRTQSASI